jgi:hypothetical protein
MNDPPAVVAWLVAVVVAALVAVSAALLALPGTLVSVVAPHAP